MADEKKTQAKKTARPKPRKHANAGRQRTDRVSTEGAPDVAREYTGRFGAPRLDFDLDQVFAVAKFNPTHAEVASFFGCSSETIGERMKNDPEFKKAFESGRAAGRLSLRRVMTLSAMQAADPEGTRHSGAMAIFLAKQPEDKGGLGMTDKFEATTSITLEVISRVAAAAKQSAATEFGTFEAEGAELPETRPADG